jgi:hypothetical protein
MAILYNITVVNTANGCNDASVTGQVSITGCSQTIIVRLQQENNAVGPFDIYTGSTTGTTAVASGQTRTQMISGVAITLVGDNPSACVTPTPTPTPTIGTTPTPTPTPSITPSVGTTSTPTPTPSITPSVGTTSTPTPTPSITPSVGITSTPTPTPTVTPTESPFVGTAYLFIEPQSGSTAIGQYLYDKGINFYGFTNISVPDNSSPAQFNIDMNEYVSFSGWTGGTFPQVRTQSVPQISGGVDSFGNAITAYNFSTHEVPVNTVGDSAWYTWIIPTGATNNGIQQKITYNINGNPNSMTTLIMDSTIYTDTFNYTGSTIPTGVYRVYTTFADLAFYIDNTANTIYFKGDTII